MSKIDVTETLFSETNEDLMPDESGTQPFTLSEQKAIDAIDRYITASPPPDNSRVFTLTPPMARYLLDAYNIDNRPIKPGKITQYACDMVGDKWGLTGDTVKFSDAKRLRDGQNRLLACVKGGKPFRTHIVFGIEDGLFAYLDRGKNRDGGDILAIDGVVNAGIVAGAVRWCELIARGTVKQRFTYEPAEILEMYHSKYVGVSNFILDAKKSGQPAAMMAALLYHFNKVDPADAGDFAAALAGGQRSGRYAPIKKAEARILEIFNASSGRVHDVVRAAVLVTAWNLFRARRKGTGKDFQWDKTMAFPTIS